MAKHPHRLMLNENKTWRCTLPNCRYFIHRGLAHVLPGQASICWECGEVFVLDERALQDDQPICDSCNMKRQGKPSLGDINEYIEQKMALAKMGVQSIDELTPAKRRMLESLGVIKPSFKSPEELAELEKDDKVENED